jgi:hypothetical protein
MNFTAHSCGPGGASAAESLTETVMMRIWGLVLCMLQRASSEIAQPSVCRDLPTKPIQVITAADATKLAELAVCPGANLTAVWHGSVALSAPIVIANGTSLSISAAAGSIKAVIDGEDATPLLRVYGILQLTNLTLENGRTSIEAGAGGAVFAGANAQVSLTQCIVQRNKAVYGAAIYSGAGAVVLLQQVSTAGTR